MLVAAAKESFPGERRVGLVPASVAPLKAIGLDVLIEHGAGWDAGFSDQEYLSKGARTGTREEALAAAYLVQVRALGANPGSLRELDQMRKGSTLIAMCDPLGSPADVQAAAERGINVLALELIPRITRAQSMDVLSSMATVAGYRAVLLAALALPKMFPMMTTAAGTITPAKVFIVGAGVAGLQAIASARRLGAVVCAYDVRPAVKEQVNSLGARFVEMELEAAEGQGGYAKEMNEEFYRRQRELMTRVVATQDVVITTAAVPGKKAPILVTAEMVKGMQPGSVIVDLAAERGGNCELTQPGKTVIEHGVTILGPANLPSEVPYHASQMYAKNVVTVLTHLIKDGAMKIDMQDEITRETLVASGGEVTSAKVKELLGAAQT